jgi:transglutaminase-like putative cysteine protease
VELEITHTTTYSFSQGVFLEPHALRFQPRADGAQTPLEFALDVQPAPAGAAAYLDACGNVVNHFWFTGLHESLTIASRAVVRMTRDNPFDFLLDRTRTRLPLSYDGETEALRPYLRPFGSQTSDAELTALAARMRDAGGGELLPVLTSLNNTLHGRTTVVHREHGEPWPAECTWRERRGACRDLAALFVEVCRMLGIAARFVSGYEFHGVDDAECELHAWAEVYVPGGGWRGYDPSRGLAVAERHVAVAAAVCPAGAAPVTGSFRGESQSRMESVVRMECRRFATSADFAQA